MKKKSVLAGAVILFSIALSWTVLSAQSIWKPHISDNYFAIEFLKPDFQESIKTTEGTSVLYFSGQYKLSDGIRIVGELPIAHGEFQSDFMFSSSFRKNQTAIGNPYVGIILNKNDSPLNGQIGVRLPVFDEDKFVAATVGLVTDFDRVEAFLHDIVTISGKINYRSTGESNLVAVLGVGPTVWLNTKDLADESMELWLDYGGKIGYKTDSFTVMGGISGRFNPTEKDLAFGERSFHQGGITVSVPFGRTLLGAHLRVPIDDLGDTIDFILGVNFAFLFK